MAIKVIGLGAGGHAKVVLEILHLDKGYELIGLLDPKPNLVGQKVLGVPVLGNDDQLLELVRDGITHFFIGLGSTGHIMPRQHLYEMALRYGMQPVRAIHPQAIISPSAKLGDGVTIMAGALINACSILGANVIINTGAIVEHDCILDNHVHIAPNATLASTVRVGKGSHIGASATIKQSVTIGEYAIVGAGAVVVKDVPSHTVVVGVPAQILKKRTQENSL